MFHGENILYLIDSQQVSRMAVRSPVCGNWNKSAFSQLPQFIEGSSELNVGRMREFQLVTWTALHCFIAALQKARF